jgi:hypothetical protein
MQFCLDQRFPPGLGSIFAKHGTTTKAIQKWAKSWSSAVEYFQLVDAGEEICFRPQDRSTKDLAVF